PAHRAAQLLQQRPERHPVPCQTALQVRGQDCTGGQRLLSGPRIRRHPARKGALVVRVVPRYRELNGTLPRRLRWTRARTPTRRHVPQLYRPEGRTIARPSARVSLLHLLATLAVAGVLWAAAALFQAVYAGRIYPHVTIGQLPVGGMTRAEALAALRDAETARLNAPIDVQ